MDLETPTADLTEGEARALVQELRDEIRRHDHLYHVLADPQISDARYDELYRRLQDLEASFPSLVTPDSPTRRVGSEPRSALPTFEHAVPLLSLDSTQKEADLRRFDERLRTALGDDVHYVLEPKLDGASVELVYEDGLLSRAVTRGNGRRGDGVTDNIRTIRSVPLRLREEDRPVPPFLSVRGEVLMYLSDFENLNERLMERGEQAFANPRNAAAGALRQLDPGITAERPLDFLAYDILSAGGAEPETDFEGVRALREWGLKVPERIRRVGSVDEVLEYHREFAADREDLDYEIDGIVVKLDRLALRRELGSTSHHPRWALAVKFEPRKEVTRVERIIVSVGRTGAITPVALLLPVDVGGVTVSKASLHNREEVQRKDIREGDHVRIQRAGDVIPQVVGRVEKDEGERAPPFRMPARCPACGSGLETSGPHTICPNRFGCPAQLKGRIVHFGSRAGLDIEGLGEETARLLVDRELVRELSDLFDLDASDLLDLPGFAELSASKLVSAIDESREVELQRFLYGLGIPEAGRAVAADLALHFGSIEALRAADHEALEEVPGVGPKMSAQIHGFLHDARNARHIDAALDRGIRLQNPEPTARGDGGGDAGPLDGKTFVFTGGLEGFTRAEAKELVERHGARVTSSVSGATDFVVAGHDPGSKLNRARELDLGVLDEEGFVDLLRETGIDVPSGGRKV